MPLFTPEELDDWETRLKEAEKTLPTDEFPHPNREYNESKYQRVRAHHQAFKMERLRRIAARPEDVVNLLLVAFYEKGTKATTWDEAFGGLGGRLTAADTPETRKHIHSIFQGLRKVPRSWAMSATTRYFRGTGAQGRPPWSNKPGAGILGKDYGWKTYEAGWFVGLFYAGNFKELFFSDDSPDPYSEEGHEIDEEGGNRFAATHKDRDDTFIEALIGVLEARGLAEDITKPNIPKPKPHKVKAFKPGDKVTASNVRDLPCGSHLRFTLHLIDALHANTPARQDVTRHYVLEAVYLGKTKPGVYAVRPILAGIAAAPWAANKHMLNDAEYIGPWVGPVEDDLMAKGGDLKGWYAWEVRWAWKPVKTSTTEGRDTSVPLVR